jgi:hypothetical protein
LGSVMRFGLAIGVADAGVEEDQSLVVLHQIGEYGLNSRAMLKTCGSSSGSTRRAYLPE